VPTASLAGSEVVGLEQVIAPREVFLRDVAWIRQSDALVAEVSTPSHGVGYEVAFALSLGKPVLCCYLEGRAVSKMITGNTSPDLTVSAYQSAGEAASVALAFLNGRTSLTNGGSTLLIEPASR
jgi:nucleoside 2-deoxyribosyltransferase